MAHLGPFEHIAVMRSGALGDFILTLPAIDALRASFPQARLLLIGPPPVLGLVQVRDILDHDHPLLGPLHLDAPLPKATRALFAGLDLVLAYAVDPRGLLQKHLQELVAGPVLVHDPRPAPGAVLHMADHLLAPLLRLGIKAADPVPRLRLEPVDLDSPWISGSDRAVLVHPGSGGAHKCWPLEYFLELIQALQARGFPVRVLAGPVEAERGLTLPGFCTLLCPPDLRALAGLLARAALFIGNDSGPGHLAAAVGVPTLSLFGPTDPRLWAPRGPRAYVLQASHHLSALSAATVLAAALGILSGQQPSHA